MENSVNNTLARLGKELNRANIFWAVGGSVLLKQYNIIERPKDIDILITTDHTQEACNILSSLGIKVAEREEDDVYATDFFYEYIIGGIEVDLISGLKIKKGEQIFNYDFHPLTPRIFFPIEDEMIPFSTLEDWLTLYHWMPNKEDKVRLIEKYLL